MYLGAHVPITGGIQNAPGNGLAIGAEAIQIFTRNQMQWRCRPLSDAERGGFREALAKSGVKVALSHGSYLVNLASPVPDFLAKSRECFLAEMARCHALGIPYLVFHPGAHMGRGEEAGLDALAASLDALLDAGEGLDVMPLLEVTAGQGSSLGCTFEQIRGVFDRVKAPERLGVCLDTCHLYAAGYDIATPAGYERTFRDFDRVVGRKRLRAVHLNDSKKGLGSRVDRHARAGEGVLGLPTFRRFLNDRRFRGIPMVVETPGPLAEWKKEIALLRRLVARPARRRPPARRR